LTGKKFLPSGKNFPFINFQGEVKVEMRLISASYT